jgi:triosephosphate isomerase
MRTPLIAGNWKMYKTVEEATALVGTLALKMALVPNVEVAVCPPFTALAAVSQALRGTPIALGAQDCFWADENAFTGQISPRMLADLGCRYVIVGHSERRGRFGSTEGMSDEMLHLFGDNDETVNLKAKAVLGHGMIPIVCCGETLAEHRARRTDEVVSGQVEAALAGLTPRQVKSLVIAYEPVWAIGTGEVCDAKDANRVIGLIRRTAAAAFGPEAAESARIQYGGSVKPNNIQGIMEQPEIDGALVGGASLNPDSFEAIVKATSEVRG